MESPWPELLSVSFHICLLCLHRSHFVSGPPVGEVVLIRHDLPPSSTLLYPVTEITCHSVLVTFFYLSGTVLMSSPVPPVSLTHKHVHSRTNLHPGSTLVSIQSLLPSLPNTWRAMSASMSPTCCLTSAV